MAFDLNKNEESNSSSKFDLSKSDAQSVNSDEKQGKSKTWLFVLLGILVLGAGAWYFLSNSNSEGNSENVAEATTVIDSNTTNVPSNSKNEVTTVTSPVDTSVVNTPENTVASNNVATPNNNTETKPINNTNTGTASSISTTSLNNRAPALFDKGSTSISNIDQSLVKDILLYLEKNPNSLVTVNGYASSEGELAVNQKISQSRAEAFKRYLVSKGVAVNRIVAYGKGIDNPIANNDTEEGRIKNRRVEISLQ